ncbi:MAG: LLM class flavin-dependent oxidoreductase [Chloroflexi bacterium]|nr:LLM class flavin-dependent oxidoreductase [Chloroflexota bacterium]
MIATAQEAERLGLHSVWLSEAYFARDAISLTAAMATTTEKILLATGVVNPYTRHPSLLAMTFATLGELAPGRIIYGLGTSEPNWMRDLGYDFSKPRTAVIEAMDVYEKMLARETVTLEGKTTQVHDARLMFRPEKQVPPIVLAAIGPRMCALARDRAAGVLLSVGGIELAKVVRERLGDVSPEFTIGMTIPMAVDDDLSAAVARVRPTIAGLVSVPEGEAILEMSGFDPGLATDLRASIARDGFREGIKALPDEVVIALTAVGTESACLDRIEEFCAAGVNLPIMQVGKHEPHAALQVMKLAQDRLCSTSSAVL